LNPSNSTEAILNVKSRRLFSMDKSKNEVIARYSLEGYSQPIGISEYEISKMFPESFKNSLPSIEDIENELKDNAK
jgi:hypothetical protein